MMLSTSTTIGGRDTMSSADVVMGAEADASIILKAVVDVMLISLAYRTRREYRSCINGRAHHG